MSVTTAIFVGSSTENYRIQVSKENLEKLNSYGEKLDELLKEYGITDNESGITDKEAAEIISCLSDRGRNAEIEGGFRKGFSLRCRQISQNSISNQVNYPPLKVYTFSPFGYEGTIVQVETDLRRGIPSHDIVGIADSAVKEIRERIRAAFGNSGLEMPSERVLQSLSPADIRKDSPMDLAMAVGILNEQNHWTGEPVLALGELELSGRIRPVRGAVAAVNSAKAAGITKVLCDPMTAELLKKLNQITKK